eukprot:TRINITY_DN436_c0_g4_i1.p1 TRINITY_DN436_c0_g4~~TRINITY_DN436_c0_g4_i1.p1  ORF type:complete len:922 (+),score=200.92 TRINITY_DN436_c0_g4_i1:25-2766(+)
MIATSPAPGGLSAEGAWGCLTHTAQPFPASADRQCTTALCGAGIMDVTGGLVCAQSTPSSAWCTDSWESFREVVSFANSDEFRPLIPMHPSPALTFGGGPVQFHATVDVSRRHVGVVFNFANDATTRYDRGTDYVRLTVHEGAVGEEALILAVSHHGQVQDIRCARRASWGTTVYVEGRIIRGHFPDGTGMMWVDGAVCARGPLYLPELLERRTNWVDRYPTYLDLSRGYVTNFEMRACMWDRPAWPNEERIASFQQLQDFDQDAPLTFGGPMYMRASVYLNSYTTWGRIFDFGNGAGQDNVVLTLHGALTNHLLLQVVHRNGLTEEVLCGLPIELHQWTTVEVMIDSSTEPIQGSILLNGYRCSVADIYYIPETVQRSSNRIGRSNWHNDDDLDGTVSNFVLTACPVARPCHSPTSFLSLDWDGLQQFDQDAPLTFGGPMHISAGVTILSYTPWARIIDFGNGAAQDNILITLRGSTKQLAVHVYRQGLMQEVVCPNDVSLLSFFTLDVVLLRAEGSATQGTAAIYINGLECANGTLHLPELVLRNKNLIGRSNWGDAPFDGSVQSLHITTCSLSQPCSGTFLREVASFQQSSDFSQEAALLSGGELYVKATVTFNSYSGWARLFDFGNGAADNNIVMSLAHTSKQIVLDVWRDGSLQRVQCIADTPLNTAVAVEATITRNPRSFLDGLGAIYIDGVHCVDGPLHIPALLERSSNLIGRSNWVGEAPLDGSVTNFMMTRCTTMPKPLGSKQTEVARFQDASDFQPNSLTFGDLLHIRTSVYLHGYTPEARIFDFSNGGQDNVLMKLVPNTKRVAFGVWRDGTLREVVCEIDLQLGVTYTVEAMTYLKVRFLSAVNIWFIALNGVVCGEYVDAPFFPESLTRSDLRIGASNSLPDASLHGTVSGFVLNECSWG